MVVLETNYRVAAQLIEMKLSDPREKLVNFKPRDSSIALDPLGVRPGS